MIPEPMLNCGQEHCCKACSPLETLPRLIRFYSCFWSIRMKDTKSKGREGFGWLWVWAFKESDWREMNYRTHSARSGIFPSSWSAKTQAACAREEAAVYCQPACTFSVSRVSTKSQRKGNWSTTMTGTSRHSEISRTVPDGKASRMA